MTVGRLEEPPGVQRVPGRPAGRRALCPSSPSPHLVDTLHDGPLTLWTLRTGGAVPERNSLQLLCQLTTEGMRRRSQGSRDTSEVRPQDLQLIPLTRGLGGRHHSPPGASWALTNRVAGPPWLCAGGPVPSTRPVSCTVPWAPAWTLGNWIE